MNNRPSSLVTLLSFFSAFVVAVTIFILVSTGVVVVDAAVIVLVLVLVVVVMRSVEAGPMVFLLSPSFPEFLSAFLIDGGVTGAPTAGQFSCIGSFVVGLN